MITIKLFIFQVTGFFGIYIIYFNKQFWRNKHYTLYSIRAITNYCLVFTASVAGFMQIKRIEIQQLHLFKLAFEKRQKNKRSVSYFEIY